MFYLIIWYIFIRKKKQSTEFYTLIDFYDISKKIHINKIYSIKIYFNCFLTIETPITFPALSENGSSAKFETLRVNRSR